MQIKIKEASEHLALMRLDGDPLKIDLAEAALNDLLDRYRVTFVTGNDNKGNENG